MSTAKQPLHPGSDAMCKNKEAADLLADSPQGILQTPDIVAKFQSVPVEPKQTSPLLQYLRTLLTKRKLNDFESFGAFPLSCGPEQEEPAGDQNS